MWKDIPGYEGRYQANIDGRIRSIDRELVCTLGGKTHTRKYTGKILSPGPSRSGHLSVVLGHGAHGSQVHQLILRTFVGPAPLGAEVRHKNGEPTDNRLSNLEYGSRTENILDVYRQDKAWRKLKVEDVIAIRELLRAKWTGRAIANAYNVSEITISRIKSERTFGWLNEDFRN